MSILKLGVIYEWQEHFLLEEKNGKIWEIFYTNFMAKYWHV